MKITKRKIAVLATNDESYVFGEGEGGFIVRDIIFRRDGQMGVNRSNSGDDAHYVVIFANEAKETYMDYIPVKVVKKVRCVDIEEEIEENDIEVKRG